VGNGTYDDTQVKGSLKLEIEVGQTADGKTAAQVEFERSARFFGLTPEDFGVEFGYAGKRYKVAGLNLKSKKKKQPLLITDPSGNTFVLDPEVYKSFRDLERANAAKAA
jgi:hypothetical protein